MKPLIFLLVFLVLAQASLAFNCATIKDQATCNYLNSVDENLIANIIYTNTTFPDHSLIENYNFGIVVNSAPQGATIVNQEYIRKAWVKILSVEPSVLYNGSLYVPQKVNLRSEYRYSIKLPPNYYNFNVDYGSICRRTYSLDSNTASISWYANGSRIGSQKTITTSISKDSQFTVKLDIKVNIKENKYALTQHKYYNSCDYQQTQYHTDYAVLEDKINVKRYNTPNSSSFTFFYQYDGSYQGRLNATKGTNTYLRLDHGSYHKQTIQYNAEFIDKPFYLLQLVANDTNETSQSNLIISNATIYTSSPDNCTVSTTTFFTTAKKLCKEEYSNQSLQPFKTEKSSFDWHLLLMLAVFLIICVLIYRLIKKHWGKILLPITTLIILLPSVSAESCGLTNLASCIPQKMYDYALNLINAPLTPLLDWIKSLLQAQPNIAIFHGVWGIIVYCVSLFYGLLFMYSGFQFLFSGHNVIRREMAKEWLKNTLIMIVLIQASYYLYGLIIQLGSKMTSSILSLVDPHFFMLTANNFANAGLEFMFTFMYVIVLLMTLVFLAMRYMIVAFGILFVPIGIFCYFIPPLRSYGKLILNLLGMMIFITFIASIIILACSMLIQISIFQNLKILIMINCFGMVDMLFLLLTKHITSKTGIDDGADKIAQAAKYIVMLA